MAMTFRSRALRSVAFIGLLGALAAPAMGQETQGTEGTAAGETDDPSTLQSEPEIESGQDASAANAGDITITGSRIRRPNLESSVPITSIGGEEFFQTGQTAIGDVLNELPALRSTFSQSNSTRFLGTGGLNLLDLRGLGTQRTLVLQNGRRHVAADILNNAVSVDTNQIPTDLIERVDVVTGGSSAIYGSDAIAGVVNFVLKRNYEGIQVRGQSGISQHGDAGQFYVSGLWGMNFAGGRGNVAINAEYAHQADWYASQRKSYRTVNSFLTVDSDKVACSATTTTNCDPRGSDGNPDAVFFKDIRSTLFSNGGTFLACCDPTGNYYMPFLFTPDGNLVPQTYDQLVGNTAVASAIGGNGNNFREGNQTGFSPRLDRYSVNLIGHFTVSDAFEPFVEAKYVRTDSLSNASGPFFISGSTLGGDVRERPRLDNPYLGPQARAFLQDYYGTTAGGQRFFMGENVLDLGSREEEARRETYRIVGGVRGTFNTDWGYEVAANYGEFKEHTLLTGNVNIQRFLLAFDAGRNPATGQIQCRSQYIPSAAFAYTAGGNDAAYANSTLAADIAACVPINLFGPGNVTQAARDYILQPTTSFGKITQLDFSAFVNGDLSQLFELPGGPIGFAIGAEYRRETNFFAEDALVQTGITFYNAIPTFDPPSFEVKEAFGEIRIPLLKDMPLFHELTFEAAGRVADYKGRTGTVFAYNVGAEWSPVRDLRFRAQYAKAVRAPNLGELFTPFGQNFAPPPADPCSVESINANPNRPANCAAAGIPVGYSFLFKQSLPYLSGGNENLNEETSKSLTVGGVFQPRFLPGFSLSADYYDIQVDQVIANLSAQGILNQCYDEPTLDNPFCPLFQRFGASGGPNGEPAFSIIPNSLKVAPVNFAKLKTRGIDAEMAYRHKFNFGTLSTRVVYTHVFQNDNFLNPATPDRANQVLLELGDPQDAFNWNVDLKSGPITVGYQLRYIGKMAPGAIENIKSVQGRDPINEDAFEIRYYPEVLIHDARLQIDAGTKYNFYLGVDNFTNRLPPYGLTGIGAGSAIYHNIGRFFYAGFTAKF
ncbi:MAG TPA: TonB-dependent receptor [Allosphingosinicella sp.]|jgi:outer membrane receptor protein involved in Fe transport